MTTTELTVTTARVGRIAGSSVLATAMALTGVLVSLLPLVRTFAGGLPDALGWALASYGEVVDGMVLPAVGLALLGGAARLLATARADARRVRTAQASARMNAAVAAGPNSTNRTRSTRPAMSGSARLARTA